MPQSKLEIKFPRPKNQGKLGLHSKFVAVGVANGQIVTVRASVSNNGTATNSLAPYVVPRQRHGMIFWYAPFVVGAPGQYQLTVEGLDDRGRVLDTKRTQVHVTKDGHKLNPEILYPDIDQNIIDERDYFITYGSRSVTAVSSVSVTPLGGTAIVNNSPYDNGTDFWSAAFDLTELLPDLPTIALVATGASATPINVCILS